MLAARAAARATRAARASRRAVSGSATLLTPERRAVIDATAPAVAGKLHEITPEFYATMFAANPEVMQFFNRSNQRNAAQPRALAEAVLAAVGHLDDLSAIDAALGPAVHKHCALGVLPGHYKIVHDNFLAATAKVLGDAVTPTVADAWSAVLLTAAGHFVKHETALYDATTAALDGWDARDTKEFVVRAKTQVARNFVAVDLERADGARAPGYLPGQFATLCANPSAEQYFAPRHYTLAAPEPRDNTVRICVKKMVGAGVPDGIMSSFVNGTDLGVGDTVNLRPPFGVFTPADADGFDNVVFISAGAGVTPAVAMLPHLAKTHRVALWQVDKTAEDAAFHDGFKGLGLAFAKLHLDAGRADTTAQVVADGVAAGCGIDVRDPRTVVMMCVPPAMNHALVEGMRGLGVDATRVKWENFGPRSH